MKDKNFDRAVINLYQAFLRLNPDALDKASKADIELLNLLRDHPAVKDFKAESTKA
jgi:hypothetical protein